MKPVQIAKTIDKCKYNKQIGVRNILNKTISKESSFLSFRQIKGDSSLMKEGILKGIRRPIQYQMQSLLLNIDETINTQVQNSLVLPQLPSVSKHNTISQKIYIYEHFRKMSNKRLLQKEQILNFTTRANHRIQSQIKLKNENIPSQICNEAERQPIVQFKKGYLSYDNEVQNFLKQLRGNMLKSFKNINFSPNQITARNYMIIDSVTLTPLYGKNTKQTIEIASISKVMTCYLTIMICKKYSINMYNHLVIVSQKAAETPGTTAQLKAGDILTVYQLLLGLMLPSGNDASVAIAKAMGKIIQKNKKKQTKKTYYQTFIAHMNLLSRELKLDQIWNNSSGLPYHPNYSSTEAIILLTSVAIKNDIFNEIVCSNTHQINIKNKNQGLNRRLLWKNTNKLLETGWEGVKAGTTQTAGHCLMARKGNFLICVFNCQSMSRRFSQCIKLYEYYRQNLIQ